MNYLENNKQMQTILQQHNSVEGGDGIAQSITSLREIIRRFDEVTALGLHQCLTFLTFEQQKSRIEVKSIKEVT